MDQLPGWLDGSVGFAECRPAQPRYVARHGWPHTDQIVSFSALEYANKEEHGHSAPLLECGGLALRPPSDCSDLCSSFCIFLAGRAHQRHAECLLNQCTAQENFYCFCRWVAVSQTGAGELAPSRLQCTGLQRGSTTKEIQLQKDTVIPQAVPLGCREEPTAHLSA